MAEDRKATERVVLKLVTLDSNSPTADRKVWEEVGRANTGNKYKDIDIVAKGEPGKYRAIPLRSWQGGKEIVIPEKPKPESRLFE